mgnify:CR=1 FL=1
MPNHPPDPPHPPENGPGHHHTELRNIEQRNRDKREVGKFIEKIGKQLKNSGEITFDSEDPITPDDEVDFSFKHVRGPEGDYAAHMEIVWNQPHKRTGGPNNTLFDKYIESETE